MPARVRGSPWTGKYTAMGTAGQNVINTMPAGQPWAGIGKNFLGSGGHGHGWAAFQTSKILKIIKTFYTCRVLCTLQLTNADQKSWFGASLMVIIIIIVTKTLAS